jgi:16S rRNA (guanine966-N2)-methyltransferase
MDVGEQRMRIVAGEFRGRSFVAPKGDTTRPTTDRVREALFSSLTSIAGSGLGAGNALDAFAGSGALGLEALSRGVERVVFVESDRAACATLQANIAALDAGPRTNVISGDVMTLAQRGALLGAPFSLLLLDPPYRLAPSAIAELISALASHDLLKDGALITYEHALRSQIEWPAGVSALTTKRYGKTEIDIAVYEREAKGT